MGAGSSVPRRHHSVEQRIELQNADQEIGRLNRMLGASLAASSVSIYGSSVYVGSKALTWSNREICSRRELVGRLPLLAGVEVSPDRHFPSPHCTRHPQDLIALPSQMLSRCRLLLRASRAASLAQQTRWKAPSPRRCAASRRRCDSQPMLALGSQEIVHRASR